MRYDVFSKIGGTYRFVNFVECEDPKTALSKVMSFKEGYIIQKVDSDSEAKFYVMGRGEKRTTNNYFRVVEDLAYKKRIENEKNNLRLKALENNLDQLVSIIDNEIELNLRTTCFQLYGNNQMDKKINMFRNQVKNSLTKDIEAFKIFLKKES